MSTTTKTGEPARRRHGSGSLVEVSPRHWSLRVYDPATRRQVYKSFVGGSRQANQALANFAADVRAGQAKPIWVQKAEAKAQAQLLSHPSERTLGQLLDEWLAYRQSLGLSPTTLHGYQRMAKRIQADPISEPGPLSSSNPSTLMLSTDGSPLRARGRAPSSTTMEWSAALWVRPASGAGCARRGRAGERAEGP